MAVDFTVPHDTFRKLVSRTLKVVERRNTIPILANVLVAVEDDGRLSVEGTDLDLSIRATAPAHTATVRKAGATTVPAALLSSILAKVKGEVRFHSDERHAALTCGRAEFRLNELPVADFPEFASEEMPHGFTLGPAHLKRIVADVAFAISTEETRYYLNGILLERGPEGELVAVATDGHRLSKLVQRLAEPVAEMPRIIVPRKTVGLFGDIAEACDGDEAVEVRFSEGRLEFEAPGLRLRSKLIDGTFPDYNRVIPSGNEHLARFEPTALAAAVDRVATVSSERGRAVKFAFDDGVLRLTVLSPDAGSGEDEIAVENGPAEMEIGFNAKYVLDALATFAVPVLQLALHDPGSPALFQIPDDPSRLVVLMPMRV
ncbi:DNA polymerase III subunit beta [Aureimonas pseudogalii]|uniref:Beta sliding clamp n=1 Tax=Aureimonas pseudogalii TaxID=1744844 RepID=A0A7W6E8W6_9HYPH|nr:DNA polymerase III subunit beta [Aureimonas pseudogalii]MBB3996910.1 DNA polymerase-3 subunit beta [Aureimonas pseudogalii]